MDIGGGVEESSRQVQVRFVTKLKPPYKTPPTSLAIPTNINRWRLSDIVNNILGAGVDDWQYQPFDIVIDGKYLRVSLEDFLLAKGISAERVIEIEYIKVVAPRREDISLHDDWVSAVDGSSDGYILTGCYDGLGRIWKDTGICTHILEGHTGPITSVCVIKPKVEGAFDQLVATASKDRALRLWKFDAGKSAQPKKIRAFKILKGHNAAVQSIAAEPSGEMVCSGSWDCAINLWQANGSDAGGDIVSVKKRKKGGGDEEPQSEGAVVSTLVGHTQCVSSVVWPQHETIFFSIMGSFY
ncbi:Transducin/WD40 repeat-like superfamily protein [Abeliophyllum distichum]|uniref:Transducin/WD40 repeat-like superfamily protein n=1 Tax=Abeliophyllum distichum TaxID=126358 RepID=A0ABD1V605_9LAMI